MTKFPTVLQQHTDTAQNQRQWIRKQAVPITAALLAYYYLAGLLYGQWIPSNSGVIGGGADPFLAAWMLGWIQHAITHFTNPFFSNAMNYPRGINLAQNAEAPLLGLVLAPFLGPLGVGRALNLSFILSPAATSFSLFIVLTRLNIRKVAAFVGAALFGFGPFMTGQATSHLNLIANPLLPLIFATAGWILFSSRRSLAQGATLGLLLGLNLYISPELTLDALILLLPLTTGSILLAMWRGTLSVLSTWQIVRSYAVGAIVTIISALPYVVAFISRRGRYIGSPQPPNNPFHASPTSFFIPSLFTRFSPILGHLQNSAVPGNLAEDGAYLGVALALFVMSFGIVAIWRSRGSVRIAGLWSLAGALLALLLELGKAVTVSASLSIPLPFRFVAAVPVARDILPLRFGLFVDMGVSVIVALGLHAGIADLRKRDAAFRAWGLSSLLFGAFAVVSWWPAFPQPFQQLGISVREMKDISTRIPPRSTVLTYPLPSADSGQPLLWQAQGGYSFHLIGSYAAIRGPQGGPIGTSYPLDPLGVEAFLTFAYDGTSFDGTSVPSEASLVAEVRYFVTRYKVNAILVDPIGLHGPVVASVISKAIGPPHRLAGGFLLWLVN